MVFFAQRAFHINRDTFKMMETSSVTQIWLLYIVCLSLERLVWYIAWYWAPYMHQQLYRTSVWKFRLDLGLIKVRVKVKVRTWEGLRKSSLMFVFDRFLITLLVTAPYRLFNLCRPGFQRGGVTGGSTPTGVGGGGGVLMRSESFLIGCPLCGCISMLH